MLCSLLLTDTTFRQIVLAAKIWPGNRKPCVCKMPSVTKPLGFISIFDMIHWECFCGCRLHCMISMARINAYLHYVEVIELHKMEIL